MQGSISVILMQPLAAAMRSSNVDVDAWLRKTDLSPQLLAEPDARISPKQCAAAWAEALRLSANPRLALDVAASLRSGTFGLVEYVCRSAATLAETLALGLRYLNSLNDAVNVEAVEEGDRLAIRILADSDPPVPSNHELSFAFLASSAREVTSAGVVPLSVAFAHHKDDVVAYERWFGAPVAFGARWTELVYAKAVLDERVVTADPSLLAILRRLAEDVSAKATERHPFTAQVRSAIGAALQRDAASIERVAQALGVTPRSLQRRMKDEGASFQAVREDVRQALAMRYLEQKLPLIEISFLLGFSQPSAFCRAFKRWTRLTPVAWRRVQHQGLD